MSYFSTYAWKIALEASYLKGWLKVRNHLTRDKFSGSYKRYQSFYILKILSAISYIHERGIVHRDIKPENIMFSDKSITSEPKLIDFGLSNKFDVKHLK